MRRASQVPTSLRHVASLALVAATTVALANLPASELPIPWLLAFTIPGAILGSWSRLAKAPWKRALLAVILQAGACYLALESVGPMTRPAALACTILPPLAFATSRNHDGDPSLALFLSFCVMLVGIILDGVDMGLLLAYGAIAFLSLHAATLAQAHRSSIPSRMASPIRAADAMATSMMMLSCMVAVFAIERTLRCLPSPSRSNQAGDAETASLSRDRRVGLDDSFILDGGNGILSGLRGEQLVRAIEPSGREIPSDLYLRCGFFTVPNMDRWAIGRLSLQDQSHRDGHVIKRATQSAKISKLTIERFGGASKFVFLPENSVRLRGLTNLVVDRLRGWIRPSEPNNDIYVVNYQNLPEPDASARIDLQLGGMNLTQLPADIDIAQLGDLLNEWQVGQDPRQAMEAIANGLSTHCRYARIEPIGPYRHKIENFLFAEGDRHGYCMHFATAAALMLRLRGVPCRIAVGLYGGTAGAGGSDERMYGSQHAHAWVEVPFEGRGFVTFDPTPPDSRGTSLSPETALAQSSEPTVELKQPLLESAIRNIRNAIAAPWAWAVVLGLAVALAMLPRREPKRPVHNQPIVAPQARRALQKLLRALAHVGHRRFHGQTLELFASDLAERNRLEPEVHAAFAAYQEVRFGGHAFDQDRAQTMARGIQTAIAMQADQRDDSPATTD